MEIESVVPVALNTVFSESFNSDSSSTVLFSLTTDLLDSMRRGDKMAILSEKLEGDAILVTPNKSYRLKRCEHTNTFYSVHVTGSNQSERYVIEHETKQIIEFELNQPQMNEIYAYLKQQKCELSDIENPPEHLAIVQLMRKFAISREELLTFSKKLFSLTINDTHLLVFSQELFFEVCREVISVITTNQLQYTPLEMDKVLSLLSFPHALIVRACELFCVRNFSEQLCISYESVCRLVAEEILYTKNTFYYPEFVSAWQQLMQTYCPEELLAKASEDKTLAQQQMSRALSQVSYFYDPHDYSQLHVNEGKIAVSLLDAFTMSYNARERIEQYLRLKKPLHTFELAAVMRVIGKTEKETDELALKHCRTTYERVHKKNVDLFRKIYPLVELTPDRLNPENFQYRVLNSKK